MQIQVVLRLRQPRPLLRQTMDKQQQTNRPKVVQLTRLYWEDKQQQREVKTLEGVTIKLPSIERPLPLRVLNLEDPSALSIPRPSLLAQSTHSPTAPCANAIQATSLGTTIATCAQTLLHHTMAAGASAATDLSFLLMETLA